MHLDTCGLRDKASHSDSSPPGFFPPTQPIECSSSAGLLTLKSTKSQGERTKYPLFFNLRPSPAIRVRGFPPITEVGILVLSHGTSLCGYLPWFLLGLVKSTSLFYVAGWGAGYMQRPFFSGIHSGPWEFRPRVASLASWGSPIVWLGSNQFLSPHTAESSPSSLTP